MTATTAPATKDDIFGVCRRLGEDFGFHPNILRVALAIGLIWSIEAVFAAYAVLGLIVLVSRLLAPVRKPKPAVAPAPVPAAAQDVETVELARAA
jgi:phage shock protein PspC (stress-responsive transcriptional regulator)